MDRILARIKRTRKSKVFHFGVEGKLEEFQQCMRVIHTLDLDKYGIQYFCIKDVGIAKTALRIPKTDGTRNIHGLIEMKEATTNEEVHKFFTRNKIPLWDRICEMGVSDDVNWWLKHYIGEKNRFKGVALEKGTLTVPPYSPLFNGSC